jgi:hypothetical protein
MTKDFQTKVREILSKIKIDHTDFDEKGYNRLCRNETTMLSEAITKLYEEGVREVVICAAIKTEDGIIARGHRHSDCYHVLIGMGIDTKKCDGEQGFITSKNRFVSREEGRILQDKAGIKSADREGYRGKTLFSEDLY